MRVAIETAVVTPARAGAAGSALSADEARALEGCSAERAAEFTLARQLAKHAIAASAPSYSFVSGAAYRHLDGRVRHVCITHCRGLVIVSRSARRHGADVESLEHEQGLRSFWKRYAAGRAAFEPRRALRAWTTLEALSKLARVPLLQALVRFPPDARGLPALPASVHAATRWLDDARLLTIVSRRRASAPCAPSTPFPLDAHPCP